MAKADPPQQQGKRRAACDECRGKKLKCSGEQPACARCVREGVGCVYSVRSQMGRPKKRMRSEEDVETSVIHDGGNDYDSFDLRNNMITAEEGMGSGGKEGMGLEMFSVGDGMGVDSGDNIHLDPWTIPDLDSYASSLIPPSLSPDDSTTGSPPLLNLPPELQQNNTTSTMGLLQQPHQHPHQHYNLPPLDPAFNQSHNPSFEPSLNTPTPPCACLSTLYLTLSTLTTLPTPLTFPSTLHPLRHALSTTTTLLTCPHCPLSFLTGMQNTQLLGTLLLSLAERYAAVLAAITTESNRAEEAEETKTFRLADLNTSTSHLHTGGLGCAAAFTLTISPAEWRSMAKKVVRAEVYGSAEGNDCCVSLLGVIAQMEERQHAIHAKPLPSDFPSGVGMREVVGRGGEKVGMGEQGGRGEGKEEHLCLKYLGVARRLVEGFDWA